MSERDTIKDIDRAGLSLLAGIGLVPGLILAVIVVAFIGGRCSKASDVTLAAKVDTVRITTVKYEQAKAADDRQTARASVAKKQSDAAKQKSDASDQKVTPLTDTTVGVRRADTTIVYVTPPEVVQDLRDLRDGKRKDAETIAQLTFSVDSAHAVRFAADTTIHARDNLIAAQRPSRCSRKCGILLGVLSTVAVYKAIK
jgi:hypothetical protein